MITLADIKAKLGFFDIDENTLVERLDSMEAMQLLLFLESNGKNVQPKDLFVKGRKISDYID